MKGLPGLGLLTKASISFIEYGEPTQRKHLLSMEALTTTAFYSLDRFKSHRRQPAIVRTPGNIHGSFCSECSIERCRGGGGFPAFGGRD